MLVKGIHVEHHKAASIIEPLKCGHDPVPVERSVVLFVEHHGFHQLMGIFGFFLVCPLIASLTFGEKEIQLILILVLGNWRASFI